MIPERAEVRHRIGGKLLSKVLGIACFLLAAGAARCASAQITVNDVILSFKAGERPLQNVIVSNSSDDVFSVSVTVERYIAPYDPQRGFEPSTDLLASPKQFSIEGKGQRTVRLLLKKQPPEQEAVYRVSFTPKAGSLDQEPKDLVGNRKAMLRIITGMGVLVFVDPQAPHPDLKWRREGDKLIFHNDGNVHVRVTDGRACNSDGTDCEDLPSKRVYGGMTFEVPVSNKKVVTYTKRDGASGPFEKIEIAPAS